MSVNLRPTKFNMREKHRNPSGTINKVSWLLSKSKRDLTTLASLYKRVELPADASLSVKQNYDYRYSWEAAYVMARYCVIHNVSKPSDVFNSINFDFEKDGATLKHGDRQWNFVLTKYFYSLVHTAIDSYMKEKGIIWMIRPGLITTYFMYEDYLKSGKIKSDGLAFPTQDVETI